MCNKVSFAVLVGLIVGIVLDTFCFTGIHYPKIFFISTIIVNVGLIAFLIKCIIRNTI